MTRATAARSGSLCAILGACAGLLTACGAEVAGTAATVGTLQVQQAEQAQAQQKEIVGEMDKALKAAAEATASAAAGQ